jgi:hypothetical protein
MGRDMHPPVAGLVHCAEQYSNPCVNRQHLVLGVQVLSECTALVKLSLAACQLPGPCQELAGMSQLRCAAPVLASHAYGGRLDAVRFSLTRLSNH